DGLDIRSAGVSRQYQMQNFSVSYSFTYNFTIMPLKVGTFKIPPQTVDAGGKSIRTPELTLNVVASAARPGRTARDPNVAAAEPGKGNFLELLVPKTTAYVGEMIPTQLRLGVNPRTPLESLGNNGLQIPGQGLTMQKIPEPRPTMEVVDGQSYQLVIFKTAIASARSGKLEIGPAELTPVVRVPRNQPRNPSLPRDLFDDPFFNNFFNDPAFAPSVAKEIKLKSQPVTLDVKPLPRDAPPTFSGAVGTFTMKLDAAPKKAKAGDPVTVTAKISGRGNFDRVTSPTLQDENGWHSYPPTDKFKQDDDVGISGEKTFEIVLSANERKDKLSPFVFTFFDPVKETYVTLRSDAIPLQIDGPAPTATPATTASSTSAPANSPSPAPNTSPATDILYQLTDRPRESTTFTPLYARRTFWLAQLLPLLGLAGFVAWRVRQTRLANREAQRAAKLQREAAELQRKLRGDGMTAEQYFADASRAVQIRTALARNVDPNVVDAAAAASAFRLDEQARARLQRLFDRNDELRYSGGRNAAEQVTAENRREILELVESLHV
ncbi:MAG: BatD family protein, partial [Chthoniobacterales bacterium]